MQLERQAAGRGARWAIAIVATAGAALASATPAHAAGCGLLGLFPCKSAPAPSTAPGTGTGGGTTTPAAPTTYRCGLLLLFTCTTPPPAGPPPDPALPIAPADNPGNLRPLPARTDPNAPLYPLDKGHVPVGLTDGGAGEDAYGGARGAAVVAGMGGKFARVLLHWPVVEPKDGTFDFSRPDALYRAYIKRGVRPVFQISGTPQWAVALFELVRCEGKYCHAEPAKPATLGDLGLRLAQRYPLLGGIEHRNEPSIPIGKRPAIPARRYAAGLSALYAGVRAADSGIPVWGGTMATVGGWTDYLTTVLHNAPMDAVAIHPYDFTTDFSRLPALMSALDAVLAGVGRPEMRVVVSEVGAPLTPGPHGEPAYANEPGGVSETAFERNLRYFVALDPGSASPNKPQALSAQRVDAILYHAAVTEPHGGGDFGWVARSGVDTPLPPRYAWCQWRASVAGLPTFPGSQYVRACPSEATLQARARARARRHGR